MKAKLYLALILCSSFVLHAQQFKIRGVLPWHNFLSGPTAWNQSDYEQYLDECKSKGINFIAFHNYTGGSERYVNYVEPMIKIQYKNILPEVSFDNSGTARWGYLPMKVKDFAFDSPKHFTLPEGAEYFGADNSITARTNEERYEKAQTLMKKVLAMAHERGMQMAMGFEFGVAPPEYASIHTHNDMYWLGNGSLVYNPFDSEACGILCATIDNILETYRGIDYIYLWLNEHCMFGIEPETALKNKLMAKFYNENEKYFAGEEITPSLKLLGAWALAYIQKSYNYIKQKSPNTRIAIGGWGGENQMVSLLSGLNKALPKDIVFSMLNPDLGYKSHPDLFKEIAKDRSVWAIPWLEGDNSLWHLQPRVNDIINHVKKAAADKLEGVIAIHWRTNDIRDNFDAFTMMAQDPNAGISARQFYHDKYEELYGIYAAEKLAPIIADCDMEKILQGIESSEYYAYTPTWGRLNETQSNKCRQIILVIEDCLVKENEAVKNKELKWLKACYEFTLLLDEVGRCMEDAWKLREDFLVDAGTTITQQRKKAAMNKLLKAPVKEMFDAFCSRINSRGELGELSSINQRLWREYNLLLEFLL